jgi:hypothetical protein
VESMDQPKSHIWFYFFSFILVAGIGPTFLTAVRASRFSDSGGYIFLCSLLILIRLVAFFGIFLRKKWGYALIFVSLFGIPILKQLIIQNYTDSTVTPEMGVLIVIIFWLFYGLPNAIYFSKRKYLFDDGAGPYDKMFGAGFKVLDPFLDKTSDNIPVNNPPVSEKIKTEFSGPIAPTQKETKISEQKSEYSPFAVKNEGDATHFVATENAEGEDDFCPFAIEE